MIPLYAGQAVGGKVFSLDDPAVVKDGTTLGGGGGTAYVPFMVSQPFSIPHDLGYNRLRRFLLRVAHAGTCTFKVTALRDEQLSSVAITRALGISDVGIINVPLGDTGSDLQLKIELTAFSAETALGNSQIYIVPRRRFR